MMNEPGPMDRPQERSAEELLRAGGDKRVKKHNKGSVSMSTFQNSGRLISAVIWLCFLAAVSYGTYLIVQSFMAG